ncbi:prepilin-type N-terminal cleavage/methylation domain-containing protein [Leuconostocaceae bacterium ESL0723]|nr:prepilin-type N-terminal cleavage/methylation domain-containing protein [Leuconostocaceae bacterium ESL0723]
MKITQRKLPGFTLIEAAVVLFIIGLLMLLILPNLNQERKRASHTHAKAMVATVQTQVDLYQNDHPEGGQVFLSDLERNHYLTKQQMDKIRALNIRVNNNEAYQA